MKKAFVYKKDSCETVIIAGSKKEAKEIVGDNNAEFIVEPVRAYNTPNRMGIVLATSINNIKTDEKVNMEYWSEIDAVIERHVAACVNELREWSTRDIELDKDGSSVDQSIMDISKCVGEVLLEKLEKWCGAEFPIYEREKPSLDSLLSEARESEEENRNKEVKAIGKEINL